MNYIKNSHYFLIFLIVSCGDLNQSVSFKTSTSYCSTILNFEIGDPLLIAYQANGSSSLNKDFNFKSIKKNDKSVNFDSALLTHSLCGFGYINDNMINECLFDDALVCSTVYNKTVSSLNKSLNCEIDQYIFSWSEINDSAMLKIDDQEIVLECEKETLLKTITN